MAEEETRSKKMKLGIVLGLFTALILGLIIYEVNAYIKVKEQRENIENTFKAESKRLKSYMKAEADSLSTSDSTEKEGETN
ncbi:MAG: hypothetical protein KDC83_06525 [Flavobacteriales bacterium]|nr:hypothetical protein [Flavobacteriales bacterium]